MKLLHRVVKSSNIVNFDGEVSIDNTVVVKPKSVENAFDENAEEIVTEEESVFVEEDFTSRLEELELEFSEKERILHEEINLKKSKIVSEAMTEAERIRKEAETGAIVMREQAKEIGFEAGKLEAHNQVKDKLNALSELISEINSKKEEIYLSHENQLIDLAYELVKKITLSEIKTDKEIIFGIIKQACKNFRNSDYVKISVAKCDISESVITDEKLLKSLAGNIPDIEIEVLPDADSGTVILDNDKEIIDASVPTQLEFLKEIMDSGKKGGI